MVNSSEGRFKAVYQIRLALAVVFCGLFALMLLGLIFVFELDNAENEFRDQVDSASSQLQHRLNASRAVVSSLAGWHHSHMVLRAGEFSVFATEMMDSYPHIDSIMYMKRVDKNERKRFIESQRDDGYVTFDIVTLDKDLKRAVVPERSLYLPVTLIEPLAPDTAILLGYDGFSDSSVAMSIYESIQTGNSTISEPSFLPGIGNVFYLFKAAYRGKVVPADMKTRLEQLDGVFGVVMRADALLPHLIKNLDRRTSSVTLYHDRFLESDHRGHIVHYQPDDFRTNYFSSYLPLFEIKLDLSTLGQPFKLSFYKQVTLADFTFVLPFIVVFFTLISMYMAHLALRRDYLHSLESERAQDDIFREKELAEVTLHSIADGVITVDVTACVDYMNEAAEELTGWRSADAVGLPLKQVFVIEAESIINEFLGFNEYSEEGQDGGSLANYVLTHKSGKQFTIERSSGPIKDRSGKEVGAVIIFRDVTQEREMALQMAHQARHDELTGLFNRREFEIQLKRSLDKSGAGEKNDVLCYFDLDQFKVVNDTCGHVAGDELLKQLTQLLRANIRETDMLARLGGDEFGLIIRNCTIETAQDIAALVHSVIREFRFVWQGKTFDVGASMGLVEVSHDIGSMHEVMSAADSACYVAKDKGRNRIFVHRFDDHELKTRHGEMQWVHRVHEAFENDRFCLYRQKVVSLKDRSAAPHYEVLVRMRDEDGQIVLPMAFIPAAERYNLMPEVDRWVIRNSLMMVALDLSDSVYNLNLSGKSINEDNFLKFVTDELVASKVDPARICFEVTETAAITHLSSAIEFINALRKVGCSFALDDFGSGLSSFAYLKNLPVDYLKIDGGFVKDMIDDPVDMAMVACIVQVGKVMGIKTIAEFVENDAIKRELLFMGVDYGQGYGIARPEPWKENKAHVVNIHAS